MLKAPGSQDRATVEAPPRWLAPAVVVLGAIGAAAAFKVGDQRNVYDAATYTWLAEKIATLGFTAVADPLRTYGYPLFVSLWFVVSGVSRSDDSLLRVATLIGYFLTLVGVAAVFARQTGRSLACPAMGLATFAFMVLNPYLLAGGAATISDGFSALVIGLAVAFTLPTAQGTRATLLNCLAAFFCAGYAAIVRPANLFLFPLLLVIWIVRAVRHRDVGWRTLAASLAFGALPIVPQVALNLNEYGSLMPPDQSQLYGYQAELGTTYLKYVTIDMDASEYPPRGLFPPFGNYVNPSPPSSPDWGTFLREQPLWAAAVTGIHVFALVDQDFPYTYVRDPSPWYRWPLSVVNYLLLALAILGLWFLAQDVRRQPAVALGVLAPLVVLGAYVGIYSLTRVEARFGLPVFVLLAPAMARGLLAMPELSRQRRLAVSLAAATVVFVVGCGALSAWMQDQSPALHQARAYKAGTVTVP